MGTRTGRLSRSTPTGIGPVQFGYSTSSDEGENFQEPQDAADLASIGGEIGGGRQGSVPRRPPMGGIDLGKGLDLEKPRPPRSAIGIEIGKSPAGNLGIGVEIPIPVPGASARGGIAIDPATGQIRGGYGGLGIGKGPIGASIDVGVDTPPGSDKPGCFKYVTFTAGPFSHTYGKNECEPAPAPAPAPTPTPAPAPTPTPTPTPTPSNSPTISQSPSLPNFKTGGYYWEYTFNHFLYEMRHRFVDGKLQLSPIDSKYETPTPINVESIEVKNCGITGSFAPAITSAAFKYFYKLGHIWTTEESEAYFCYTDSQMFRVFCSNNNTGWYFTNYVRVNYIRANLTDNWTIATYSFVQIREFEVLPPSSPTIPFSPPIPNPPPTKKKMDDCCKIVTTLLLMQHRHLGVTPIPGMESLNQFAGITPKGETFKGEQMAFPFEVPKVWLDPTAKREDKISVKNISELLFIIGAQSERIENFLGTKEFLKDSQFKLRNSDSGVLNWVKSKLTGQAGGDFSYPDPNDYWFNTDDGVINEKQVEVRSLADAMRYLVESQNRLERILPIAELKNSSIPARWVYPGKKGQLNVGNLIHLVEYMFRADDRARGYLPIKIKVKDANPAVKGDQPVYLEFQSQADLLKEMFKFIIDVEGDGDQSNNFLLRLAMQSCQNHQLNVQNNAMLDAIVEYLDFKVNRVTTKVPMPFSPFAGKEPNLLDKILDKLGFKYQPIPGKIDKNTEQEIEELFEGVLQNTEVKVPIVEIPAGEKKYLSEALMEILKHASAASAAVSERVGDGALKRMIESAGIAQAVSRFLLKKDIAESNGVGDLDKWINSAELGYTDKPESQSLKFPESDPLEPYDRPISENPLIREIDTKDPKAD